MRRSGRAVRSLRCLTRCSIVVLEFTERGVVGCVSHRLRPRPRHGWNQREDADSALYM